MEYGLFALFVCYLAPWILAEARGHERAGSILALNLTAGWTGLGWVAALLWARSAAPGISPAPPPLHLVPAPPGERAAGGRGAWRLVAVVAFAALLLAIGWGRVGPGALGPLAGGPAAGRPLALALPATLHARPDARAEAVGSLPADCVVQVVDRRAGWSRIWRTSACPPGAAGRSAGWVPTASLP